MKIALLLALASSTAVAAPKTKTKPAPDKFAKAASEAFQQALAADTSGDLATALGLYQKALIISPHPSTAYNLADVLRRTNSLGEAIEMYESYLLLAPGSDDAKEVAALIASLRKTPAVLKLTSLAPSHPNSIDLGLAYVFLDGELLKKAGEPVGFDPSSKAPEVELAATVKQPRPRVSVVTSITYGAMQCERALPGRKFECRVDAKPRIDGSVVVDLPLGDVWVTTPGSGKNLASSRFTLPPGKQTLVIKDHSLECEHITVDVPTGDDVAYLFFTVEPTRYNNRCRSVSVTQRRLKF